MPTPRVLTERELNRAVLARQLLLERAAVPIPRALERMCGLQDQYAPNGYIGLWTRLASFRRDDLTRALERKTVIQATLMRATIHLVSRRDYWPMAWNEGWTWDERTDEYVLGKNLRRVYMPRA